MSVSITSIAQLSEGQRHTMSVGIDQDKLDAFAALTGDHAPVHTDSDFAAAKGYTGCVAHGLLVSSFYSTILGCHLPGPNTVIMQVTTNMVKPVYVGDIIEYSVSVERVSEGVGSVSLSLSATNQNGEAVNRGTAICIFR